MNSFTTLCRNCNSDFINKENYENGVFWIPQINQWFTLSDFTNENRKIDPKAVLYYCQKCYIDMSLKNKKSICSHCGFYGDNNKKGKIIKKEDNIFCEYMNSKYIFNVDMIINNEHAKTAYESKQIHQRAIENYDKICIFCIKHLIKKGILLKFIIDKVDICSLCDRSFQLNFDQENDDANDDDINIPLKYSFV